MKVIVKNGTLHHGVLQDKKVVEKVYNEGDILDLETSEAKGLIEAGIVEAANKAPAGRSSGDGNSGGNAGGGQGQNAGGAGGEQGQTGGNTGGGQS